MFIQIKWWARRDLNPQSVRNTILSRARIPFRHIRFKAKSSLTWPEAKIQGSSHNLSAIAFQKKLRSVRLSKKAVC